VQIEGISKLVDRLNETIKQKMDVDDFEAKNGDKATEEQFSTLERRVHMIELQHRQSVFVLSDSIGLHVDRADETVQTK